MGVRKVIHFSSTSPMGLSAPLMYKQERMWRRMHREDAFRAQNRRCCYCQEPMKMAQATADHLHARSRGGTTSSENIAAACRECNKVKSSIPEKRFKQMVRHPPEGASLYVLLAHFRYTLWTSTHRICERITVYTGIPPP
jgi:5-methylcytosine-specific restriction endonuclease McrA